MPDLALLKAEIETGMYKKPTAGLVKEFQYQPLEPEVHAVVIAACQSGGLLPKATIDELAPLALLQAVNPAS